MSAWLITGGCGFIGRNLIQDLLAEGGHGVRIVDNLSEGSREDLEQVSPFTERSRSAMDSKTAPQQGAVELVVGDIRDTELALAACGGCDVIVHLAANTGVAPSVDNPRLDCEVNVLGTLNYLEAARHNQVQRFVFASSGAPVGECQPPIHEELAPHPVSPYGASKLAGEGYCSAYCRTFGVETVALRFGNVYGPLSGRKSSVVAKFIRRALAGEPLEIYGDGGQTRDFIYIDDLVAAVRLAASTPDVGGEVFQIATARETTVSEVAERLTAVLQKQDIGPVSIEHAAPRLGDVQRNFSDTSKAESMLGWSASTSLEKGLEETVQWFVAKREGSRSAL